MLTAYCVYRSEKLDTLGDTDILMPTNKRKDESILWIDPDTLTSEWIEPEIPIEFEEYSHPKTGKKGFILNIE